MCTHGDCVLHRVESQLGSGQLCFPEHRVWCCFQSYYFPMLPINLPKIIPTSPNLLDYSAHCSSSTRFVLVLMARVGWLPRVSISPANSTWKWWHCFLCHVYSALHCTFHDSTTLLLTWRKRERERVCVCTCCFCTYYNDMDQFYWWSWVSKWVRGGKRKVIEEGVHTQITHFYHVKA